MAKKPDTPCSLCGKLRWQTKGGKPMICLDCRRATMHTPPDCPVCGERVRARKPGTTYCSLQCFGKARAARQRAARIEAATHRIAWRDRSTDAPGLKEHPRRRLLHKWRAQGRRCIYCGGAPETVDHVVPLARGGTNYEGNLAPACRSCNSSKCDSLVTEWRRRAPDCAPAPVAVSGWGTT